MVLIDLIELLHEEITCDHQEEMMIKVDLSDLASLAKKAKYKRDFDLSTERMKIVSLGTEMQVQVQGSSGVTAEDDKIDRMSHLLRRMSRHLDAESEEGRKSHLEEGGSCSSLPPPINGTVEVARALHRLTTPLLPGGGRGGIALLSV